MMKQKPWLVIPLVALLSIAARPARGDTVDPRQVLQQAFDESPPSSVKIHAAEALLAAGDARRVLDVLRKDDAIPAQGAPLGYRIGVWRTLAAAAVDDAERTQWVRRIRDVALDVDAPDRLHAIESLAKLRYTMEQGERVTFAELAKTAEPGTAAMVWWLLAVSREAAAKPELVKLLASPTPAARLRSAYALRHIGGLSRDEWNRIAELAYLGDRDPLADAYVASAAYAAAPTEDLARPRKTRVIELARNGTPKQQYECANALGERGGEEDLPLLGELLTSPDTDVRIAAAGAVLKIRSRVGVPEKPATHANKKR